MAETATCWSPRCQSKWVQQLCYQTDKAKRRKFANAQTPNLAAQPWTVRSLTVTIVRNYITAPKKETTLCKSLLPLKFLWSSDTRLVTERTFQRLLKIVVQKQSRGTKVISNDTCSRMCVVLQIRMIKITWLPQLLTLYTSCCFKTQRFGLRKHQKRKCAQNSSWTDRNTMLSVLCA